MRRCSFLFRRFTLRVVAPFVSGLAGRGGLVSVLALAHGLALALGSRSNDIGHGRFRLDAGGSGGSSSMRAGRAEAAAGRGSFGWAHARRALVVCTSVLTLRQHSAGLNPQDCFGASAVLRGVHRHGVKKNRLSASGLSSRGKTQFSSCHLENALQVSALSVPELASGTFR